MYNFFEHKTIKNILHYLILISFFFINMYKLVHHTKCLLEQRKKHIINPITFSVHLETKHAERKMSFFSLYH